MSDRPGTSKNDTIMVWNLFDKNEDENDSYNVCDHTNQFFYQDETSDPSEFCIVKLKNDLNIFERRHSSLIEDVPGAVYFRYDDDILREHQISALAESEEKYPETHSRKYFFLPKKYMEEGNEVKISELYTNLIIKMNLEEPVTVVQVEPADYKAAFENDLNLVWFASVANIDFDFDLLNPVICMFSEKDQMDQFYAALAARNRDFFMNEDPDYLFDFVNMIEIAAEKRHQGDSFRYQHIEAFSAAILHILKTSSYISGKAQETQRYAKYRIGTWIDYNFNDPDNQDHPNRPGVFEELQANIFHLYLTRLIYKNYFANRRLDYLTKGLHLLKPAYWNPSHFGWVICEAIEAELRNHGGNLELLSMWDIFQQPCFRRFLKDEQLRKNFEKFVLHDYPIIKATTDSQNVAKRKCLDHMHSLKYDCFDKNAPEMETLFGGNYEVLEWRMFLNESTFGYYGNRVKNLFQFPYKGISVMDTINITTAMLAMYPEEKGERRKETANYLLQYMDQYFVLGILPEECIISEEKETDHFKEMQKILATCFHLPEKPPYSYFAYRLSSDFSSELPLDRIYQLYCQSNKQVNPSAGLLWLGIAHRQAIGSLGELSEEQQTNCLEMLASALDNLPLQTIETFFSSIQGFTTRKTNNISTELGKEQTRAERIEKRIATYIAQRKEEETAVLFLLHSEIGVDVVKVNANMARYEKRHTTSAGIFVFMTLFEYKDEVLEGASYGSKKTFDYYVMTFTKYLINNTKVKEIFYKKNQLRNAVWVRIKDGLKDNATYDQLNDLFSLDWQTHYNKWVAEKPVIGKFDLNLIRDKEQIGDGGYGNAHICRHSEFMFPIVYKQFSDTDAFRLIVRELNSLMKAQSHPHVVRIFGLATDQDNVAKGLMMEYCEGGSLDKLIGKSDYTYDGKKAVHWMAQAASALIFFQKIGVVHLDIKPANMLLCKDHHYLKIADMGITLLAEIQDKMKSEPSISQNNQILLTSNRGTEGFMAPEVMGSDKEKMVCSYASDIFSLGRTLWNIYYHKEHPWDHIVNQTVIMPVFKQKTPIFVNTDIPEDHTPQAVENITADMGKTLEQAVMPDDVKLECPERIAKWIIRMTRYDPDTRPTAVILHEEFKNQYEEYKRIEKEEVLKEKDSILRVTPQKKLCFSAPMKDKQTANVEIANASETDDVQWVATCSDPDLKVNPNEGNLKPQDAVTVDVTCIKLKDTSMDNLLIKWHRLPHRSSHETDGQQEHIKKLKIKYNF